MTTRRTTKPKTRERIEPFRHPEEAARVLAAAALDVDAVAFRTANALRRLDKGGADRKLVEATRRAVEGLAQVSLKLRREGLLGPPTSDQG